ncbi:hypothetical protein SAY86_019976 [Trapa natans]|uniref:Uncharacterized protein n=1 Tax=Trapa natans TaxID=22666 RepID=A0AAN7R3R2_TRANT|nr:hypothetical protein SAY86_019976 [Trapa natans]
MDRSEPALIPEWLKSSGSATNGGYGNHQSASCLHSDDHSVWKHSRNKSSIINRGHAGRRSFDSGGTTSSYFKHSPSGKDSSLSRSYSSFNRNHRDREWDDAHDFRDKERSFPSDHKRRDYTEHIGGVLPSKYSKETLRRSQSMVSRKLEGPLPKKVVSDSADASNSKNHIKSSSLLLSNGSIPSSTQSFVREFPSLMADKKQSYSELRGVPSPVLPSSVQNFPSAVSSVIGADGWTSSLVEVPGVIASNSASNSTSPQAASGSSVLPQCAGGLNMAEAVVQGPSRARTPPQVSVDTQRLEELAIKQSRQLIPVISSTPKPTLHGPSDKSKPRTGQPHVMPSHVNQSLRSGSIKFDSGKISNNLGKLQVLKPVRELNGVSSILVNYLSPKNGVKVVNTPISPNLTAAAAVPLRTPATSVGPERKSPPASANLEKRPSVQAKSRSDFFNLIKKKASSSASGVSAGNEGGTSTLDNSPDSVVEDSADAGSCFESETLDSKPGDLQPRENGDKAIANGDGIEWHYYYGNREDQSDIYVPFPNEEEAAFLRSLGWEENGEDEGLTEDEIRNFFEYTKMKPRSGLMGMQQLKVNNNNGSCVGSSTGTNMSNS